MFILHISVQSGSGQEGCIVNVPISSGVIFVPPGTVCIECVLDSVLATDAEFQIDNQNIDESVGIEDNGVLVVFNTENVFSSSSTRTLKCTSDGNMAQALIILASKCLLYIIFCMCFRGVGTFKFKRSLCSYSY